MTNHVFQVTVAKLTDPGAAAPTSRKAINDTKITVPVYHYDAFKKDRVDASKEEAASEGIVVQAFALSSTNLPPNNHHITSLEQRPPKHTNQPPPQQGRRCPAKLPCAPHPPLRRVAQATTATRRRALVACTAAATYAHAAAPTLKNPRRHRSTRADLAPLRRSSRAPLVGEAHEVEEAASRRPPPTRTSTPPRAVASRAVAGRRRPSSSQIRAGQCIPRRKGPAAAFLAGARAFEALLRRRRGADRGGLGRCGGGARVLPVSPLGGEGDAGAARL
nr:unnamed protein product [Digitaria exilis]